MIGRIRIIIQKGKGCFVRLPHTLGTPGPTMTVPWLISDTQTPPLLSPMLAAPKDGHVLNIMRRSFKMVEE